MAYSQFGTNANARRKRVYYEGDSTIREGMPLCYNYDATANVLGLNKATGLKGATTAEGNMNEGKFLLVEDPDSENLQFFAGVVAGASYAGLTGPRWLDIYVPNGAIVPVRAGVSCYVGVTVLAIQDNSLSLETPVYGTASATVAIAEETIDRSTDGLVLAKLVPVNTFSNGTYDIPLRTGDGVSSGTIRVFERDISTRQTGGQIQSTIMRLRLKGNGSYCDNGGVLACETYVEGSNDAPAGNIMTSHFNVLFDPGCTLGAISVSAIKAVVSEVADYGCTKTNASIAPLYLLTSMDDETSAARLSQIMFAAMGNDKPDYMFYAITADAIAYEADTTGVNQAGAIKIRIAGTDHYLHTFDNIAGASS